MTLRAIADQLGVKPVTIYRRMKASGIEPATLRDDNGNITPEGASIIASLFDATPNDTVIQKHINAALQSESDDTSQNVSDDTVSAAVLLARLEGAQALIEQLTGERDELRRQLAAAQAALAAEQEDRQQERRLLTGDTPDGSTKRRGLFSWLRHVK